MMGAEALASRCPKKMAQKMENQRLAYAQAYPTQAALNSRLQWVCFWTTPPAYPLTIEDYLPAH
jgi:hypothetical protein